MLFSNLKRGDIVYVELGKGKGSEQAGTRPAVVIQNDIGNRFSPTTIVSFLTTSGTKTILPTHVNLDREKDMILDKYHGINTKSTVLLEQVRTIDKQRIVNIKGKLTDEAMVRVNKALAISIGL